MKPAKPSKEIHVFGVMHSTGKGGVVPRDSRANNVATTLFAQVEARKAKRLGVEYLHSEEEFDSGDSTKRFWKAVYLNARRRRIQLVPLEGALPDNILRTFHNVVTNAYADYLKSQGDWVALRRRFEKAVSQDKLNLPPSVGSGVLKLIEEVEHSFPIRSRDHLLMLGSALCFLRSLRMYNRARNKRLGNMIVGRWHAADLEHVHEIETTMLEAAALQAIEKTTRGKRNCGSWHSSAQAG